MLKSSQIDPCFFNQLALKIVNEFIEKCDESGDTYTSQLMTGFRDAVVAASSGCGVFSKKFAQSSNLITDPLNNFWLETVLQMTYGDEENFFGLSIAKNLTRRLRALRPDNSSKIAHTGIHDGYHHWSRWSSNKRDEPYHGLYDSDSPHNPLHEYLNLWKDHWFKANVNTKVGEIVDSIDSFTNYFKVYSLSGVIFEKHASEKRTIVRHGKYGKFLTNCDTVMCNLQEASRIIKSLGFFDEFRPVVIRSADAAIGEIIRNDMRKAESLVMEMTDTYQSLTPIVDDFLLDFARTGEVPTLKVMSAAFTVALCKDNTLKHAEHVLQNIIPKMTLGEAVVQSVNSQMHRWLDEVKEAQDANPLRPITWDKISDIRWPNEFIWPNSLTKKHRVPVTGVELTAREEPDVPTVTTPVVSGDYYGFNTIHAKYCSCDICSKIPGNVLPKSTGEPGEAYPIMFGVLDYKTGITHDRKCRCIVCSGQLRTKLTTS